MSLDHAEAERSAVDVQWSPCCGRALEKSSCSNAGCGAGCVMLGLVRPGKLLVRYEDFPRVLGRIGACVAFLLEADRCLARQR